MTTSWSLGTSWVLFLLCLKSVAPQDGDGPLEVITESSPCSATCGLGVRSQTLCRLKDAQTALKEDARGTSRSEVTQQCRRRTVRCLVSWHCGLRTLTAAEGQSLRIDCVDEVVEQLGSFSWRVSWRYARGVITTDDSLFARRQVPRLGHVLLDPVREEDAGTYRCDVQDAGFRTVKRIYWGVRVLPPGFVNLDFQRTRQTAES